MVLIDVRLICDRCSQPFGQLLQRTQTLLRGEIESLREAADAKGWARFRESAHGSMGDYCPRCSERITAERAEKKGAR